MMLLLRVLVALAVHIAAAQGCDLTFNQVSGTFTSPGFPRNAGDNLNCQITIQAEADQIVHITCRKFHISSIKGCQEQYLKIEDVYFCKNGGIENMANEGGPMAMTFVTSAKGGTQRFTCKFFVTNPTPVRTDANACRLGGTYYAEHTTLDAQKFVSTATCLASEWTGTSDPSVGQGCAIGHSDKLESVQYTRGGERHTHSVAPTEDDVICYSLWQSGNAVEARFGVGILFEGGVVYWIINNGGHIVRATLAEMLSFEGYHEFTNGAVYIRDKPNYAVILLSNGLQVIVSPFGSMVTATPTMVDARDLQGLCGHYDGAGDITISSRDGSETQTVQNDAVLDATILDSWKLDPVYCLASE